MTAAVNKIFFFIFFPFFPSSPVGCEHNNWLYRSGLNPLSATNLCYGKYISYTKLDFINIFFMKFSVRFFEAYTSIIIFFLSGVKPRNTASSRKP